MVGRVTEINRQPIQGATVVVSYMQGNSNANCPISVAGKGSVLQKVSRSPLLSQVMKTTQMLKEITVWILILKRVRMSFR